MLQGILNVMESLSNALRGVSRL